ncbi:MAG: endonuclease/exonuclease/phosphatase family protein, partial [Actinomycetospora chiangmaiensis]|nr:endonuclease/exonuclease/phosphatase family protein [Actinomycetospora chiangmaiensis]
MRITTWNVNSIKQRLPLLLGFLGEARPDVVCLQELKCQDEAFPRTEVEAAGYAVETLGQKAYNGVALLVRQPLDLAEIRRGLPGDPEDEQARYIEALVSGPETRPVRVASIYLPNGNPVASPKYPYKLAFLERLRLHARGLLEDETAVVLAGDYNVIPEPADAADPEAWRSDALFLP